MFQNLICTKESAVSIFQLNRPQKKISLNEALRQEMETVLNEIAGDSSQRVVIVTSGEEFFCAGADIGDTQEPKPAALPRLALGGIQDAHQQGTGDGSRFRPGTGCTLFRQLGHKP
jgi:enoyl-CoA hydratase/carnithine racemase